MKERIILQNQANRWIEEIFELEYKSKDLVRPLCVRKDRYRETNHKN